MHNGNYRCKLAVFRPMCLKCFLARNNASRLRCAVLLIHFKSTGQNDPHSRFVKVILQIWETHTMSKKIFIQF